MPGPEAAYESAPARFPESEDEHSKLLEAFLQDLKDAESAQKPFKDTWRRLNKLYNSQVTRDDSWRSKVFFGLSFFTIETVLPRIASAPPKAVCYPVGPEDVEPARAMEDALNWAFDQSGLFEQQLYTFRNALKYGTGIFKVYHDTLKVRRPNPAFGQPTNPQPSGPVVDPLTQRVMRGPDLQPVMDQAPQQMSTQLIGDRGQPDQPYIEDVVYDGPIAEAIDPFEFYPAPDATTIANARYVIQRVLRSVNYVRAKISQGVYQLPPSMALEALVARQDDPIAMRRGDTGKDGQAFPCDKVEVHELWTDAGSLTCLNRVAIVRVAPNPFAHGKKPYVAIHDHAQEGEFWGKGEIEPGEGIQDSVNAVWNQRIDSERLRIDPVFIVNPELLESMGDLETRPGKVIRVKSKAGIAASDVVATLDLGDVPQSAYTEVIELMAMWEKMTGVTGFQTGSDSPLSNDTATGILAVSEQAGTRFSFKLRVAEMTGMKDLARMFGSILQQYAPTELIIRRQGAQGAELVQNGQSGMDPMDPMAQPGMPPDPNALPPGFQMIGRAQLQGALDYDIETQSTAQTETVRQNKAMAMLNTFAALVNPLTGAPLMDITKLASDVLREFGYKDADSYFLVPGTMQTAEQMGPGQVDPTTGQPMAPPVAGPPVAGPPMNGQPQASAVPVG